MNLAASVKYSKWCLEETFCFGLRNCFSVVQICLKISNFRASK